MTDGTRFGAGITPRILIGGTIIVFGLLLMAGNLGWLDTDEVFAYWPLIFVVFGLVKIATCATPAGRSLGVLLMLLGAWWTADNVHYIHFHLLNWWPLLLVAGGVLLLMRSSTAQAATPGVDSNAGDVLSGFAMWSGARRRTTSQTFRHADAVAVMGGVDIDLRQASTATGEATVEAFAFWGGVVIRVPPDWAVVDQTIAFMGGTDDKTMPTQPTRHRLILKGFVMMGGIEVRS